MNCMHSVKWAVESFQIETFWARTLGESRAVNEERFLVLAAGWGRSEARELQSQHLSLQLCLWQCFLLGVGESEIVC
jgi:hypothetical protein